MTLTFSLIIYIISSGIFYEYNDCYLNVLCDAIINKIKKWYKRKKLNIIKKMRNIFRLKTKNNLFS